MRSLSTATKRGPRSLQLEKAHAQQRRPNAAKKNKFIKKKATDTPYIIKGEHKRYKEVNFQIAYNPIPEKTINILAYFISSVFSYVFLNAAQILPYIKSYIQLFQHYIKIIFLLSIKIFFVNIILMAE